MSQPIIINTLGGSGNGLGIKRDEETVTKIDSNPRSRAPVYEPISLQNEADYFLSSAASKNDDGNSQCVLGFSNPNQKVQELFHFYHAVLYKTVQNKLKETSDIRLPKQ